MRSGTLLVLWLAACASSTPDDGPAPAIDPTAFGPDGTAFETTELSVEARTDGFPTRMPTLVVGPRNALEDPPVVVFAHGAGWKPEDYFDTLAHLASYGMIVVAPRFDQVGSTRDDGGLVRDLQLVLRTLRETPPTIGELTGDVDVFGVAGHGRGAKQVAVVAARDERVAAALLLGLDDAPSDTDPLSAVAVLGDVAVPVAQIGYGLGIYGEPACIDAGADYTSAAASLPKGGLTFELPTAGQFDVVDTCFEAGGTVCSACAPGEEPLAARRLTRSVAVAFLGLYLQGSEGYRTWLDSDGPAGLVEDLVVTRQ
ncbi:MAG: hypothetical protein H6732_04400 [Alphaproteobacteria bacterium]|nr:hypothetical protein [Alphaproteobacteria bacterium]